MVDLEYSDYLNFFYSKSGKFKVDRKSIPFFQSVVASHAEMFAPGSPIVKSFDHNLMNFRRFWKGYEGRKEVACLNAGENMPIHSQHSPPPVLTEYVRVALGPNVGNALISVSTLLDPAIRLERDVNAYSRNRHPPKKGEKRGAKVSLPKSENPMDSLPDWMPVSKNPVFDGNVGKRNCTENRILNGIHAKMGNVKLAGKIVLYTDRVPCSSCRTVISKFLKFHQDIKLEIVYAYPKEYWAGEYFEVGSLLRAGADVTLVRKKGAKKSDLVWPDFWIYA